MQILKQSAPHLRRKDTLMMMMLDVLIALTPLVIFALVVYRLDALRNILVSVATMELAEFIFVLIKNRLPYDGNKHTFKEKFTHAIKGYSITNVMVPLVSAVIFSLIMPAKTNPSGLIYVALITGSAFGLTIGKLVFGGTGTNIFNPAAVGMAFSKLCFGSKYVLTSNPWYESHYDTVAGATALSPTYISASTKTFDISSYSLLDLFLGRTPGLMGEVCKLLIIVGLIYLVIRHTCDFRIPLAYIGTFFFIMVFAGIVIHHFDNNVKVFNFATYQLLTGGLLFGATFMATDPVTSPITRPGRLIFGSILGVLTAVIRLFGALPEGVVFSILIGNMLTPLIDYRKWSTNNYNWKNILIISLIIILSTLIIACALGLMLFKNIGVEVS